MQDILIPQDLDNPAIQIDINRQRASQLGLSQREIVSNLITAVASNQMIAPTFWTDPKSNNDYYLTVQYAETQVKGFDDLREIPLHSATQARATSLDAVGNISRVQAPTEVDHYGLRKVIDTYVSITTKTWGASPTVSKPSSATQRCPRASAWTCAACVQGMRASFRSFGFGLILAVLLLYLILVAQFRSFLDPCSSCWRCPWASSACWSRSMPPTPRSTCNR